MKIATFDSGNVAKALCKERPEWPTAIHEAGHVVIARVLGLEVIDVAIMIMPPDGWIGLAMPNRTKIRIPPNYGRVRGWRSRGSVYLAGRIAQERACPGSLNPEVDAAGVLDFDLAVVAELARRLALLTCVELDSTEAVREIIELVSTKTVKELIELVELLKTEYLNAAQKRKIRTLRERLTMETIILVQEHWIAIERVAEALLNAPVSKNWSATVSGAEVDALISS